MDDLDISTARGLRFTWHYRDAEGREQVGVPADGTPFTPAGPPAAKRLSQARRD